MKICWKCTHPQDVQNVLHHSLTNESSAMNGCHQNESEWLKKHNNPYEIHTNPVEMKQIQYLFTFFVSF